MSHETHDSKSSFKLKHLAVLLQCRIAVKTRGQKNELSTIIIFKFYNLQALRVLCKPAQFYNIIS